MSTIFFCYFQEVNNHKVEEGSDVWRFFPPRVLLKTFFNSYSGFMKVWFFSNFVFFLKVCRITKGFFPTKILSPKNINYFFPLEYCTQKMSTIFSNSGFLTVCRITTVLHERPQLLPIVFTCTIKEKTYRGKKFKHFAWLQAICLLLLFYSVFILFTFYM